MTDLEGDVNLARPAGRLSDGLRSTRPFDRFAPSIQGRSGLALSDRP